MTNLKHILTDEEWSGLREMSVIEFAKRHIGIDKESGRVMLCSALGCKNCRFEFANCSEKIAEWLDEEYQEPLPFPINTVLEAKNSRGHLYVFYYKGRDEQGRHVGSAFREKDKGSFTFDIDTARKVGE